MRGALMDLFNAEKEAAGGDIVKAWSNLQSDPAKRKRYQRARGKGGFRRAKWDEVVDLITAANIYTIQKYGSDRIIGFAPIPAKSMLSYASGARYLQLMGGINLSFYDCIVICQMLTRKYGESKQMFVKVPIGIILSFVFLWEPI
jgi:nitrate reductase alpha subunit